jgi:hypothetical protein
MKNTNQTLGQIKEGFEDDGRRFSLKEIEEIILHLLSVGRGIISGAHLLPRG